MYGLLCKMNVLHHSGYVYRWIYQRILHEITILLFCLILWKHLTNAYETRSVSFSHVDILSHSLSFHIKHVYRPEMCAHGQCEFLEKLNMGDFTTRFLKRLCALFFREESGKPNDLQKQRNIADMENQAPLHCAELL